MIKLYFSYDVKIILYSRFDVNTSRFAIVIHDVAMGVIS